MKSDSKFKSVVAMNDRKYWGRSRVSIRNMNESVKPRVESINFQYIIYASSSIGPKNLNAMLELSNRRSRLQTLTLK